MTVLETKKQLRSFGFIVGGIFSLIGLWPVLRSSDPRPIATALGGSLIFLGIAWPGILVWPYRIWMKIGHVLGWINTRIILAIVYFSVVTPLGLLMRAVSGDPMRRSFEDAADSYRVSRTPRHGSHLKRQF